VTFTVSIPDRVLRFGLKPLVFIASLGPAAWLVWAIATGNLSANPLSDLTNETGIWALRFVCITLAITPLRRLTRWNQAIKFRRMVGLFAFFYGTLHFLTYIVVDRFASLVDFPDGYVAWSTARHLAAAIWEDIYKRPFITIGFSAWLTMLPLTLTSTAGMIRRLGGRAWNRLHRVIYGTGVLVVIHYWWLVKADVSRPAAYGVVVAVLLASRVYWSRAGSRRRVTAHATAKPLPTLQRSR
jgi:sulfoxide reductase heme-binding subunit YedZ